MLQRPLYRLYRKMKVSLLRAECPLAAKPFFYFLEGFNRLLSGRRRRTGLQRLEDVAWKMAYWQRFGTSPLFSVGTSAPVAVNSDDHKWPRGAIYDSSQNRGFNVKVRGLFPAGAEIRLLDLGCAGGGLVRSFLEDGCLAVGVEGSDIPRMFRLAEWDNCPHHLLTGDLTHPFSIQDRQGTPMAFNLVTAWEVLEHIPAESVPVLVRNISSHLSPGGFFIGSVDTAPDGNPLTGAVYHRTLRPKDWWIEQFVRAGFVEVADHPFDVEDYVRGNGLSLKDWDPRDGEGFHLVLQFQGVPVQQRAAPSQTGGSQSSLPPPSGWPRRNPVRPLAIR
jgi:SAM-dependent methyltransferase